MSEVLHAKVTESDKDGISRRRVVAGVAWSLPVIATAIAAPAAAASAVPASVTWGLIGAASAAGSSGSLTVQAPTTFDIQTGTAFTGSSVSYTIAILADKSEQSSKVEITSASPGTGTSSVGQGADKATTFAGTLTTTPGSHLIRVALAGFKYSKPNKAGAYTYTVTLTVTIGGITLTPAVSTLTITFP